MRAPLSVAIAALLVAISCSGPTMVRGPSQPYHVFHAYASTLHDTLYSYCGIEGAFPDVTGVPPWQGQTSLSVMRYVATNHGVGASQHRDVTVSYSITQDSGGLVLRLDAPIDTTMTGSIVTAARSPTNGTWTCPASLPFRDDTFLITNGYQGTPAPTGTWDLRWMIPVD